MNYIAVLERSLITHFSSVDPRQAVNQAINVNGPFVDIGEARLGASSIAEPLPEIRKITTAASALARSNSAKAARAAARGGRNLETALRCAIKLDGETEHFVLLSAGTDGIDGNSPADGAIADENTLERARAPGLDAHEFLANSDSYNFFQPLNDVIVTGPTDTNVRDIRIFLRSS